MYENEIFDIKYSTESNYQLLIMLLSTLILMVTSALVALDKKKESIFSAINFSASFSTMIVITFFGIKINSIDSGLMTPNNLPYWFYPWWLLSEIMFVLALLIFITYYFYQKYASSSTLNIIVPINNDSIDGYMINRKVKFLYFIIWLIPVLTVIVCSLLMFFLCNINSC